MITEKENTRISKFLSLVLRHQPDAIHIQLDEQGWTDVDVLIRQLNHHNFRISFEELKYVVASNSKKRFAFNEDCTKIRANQGHSVDVELGYEAQEPPEVAVSWYSRAVLRVYHEDRIAKTGATSCTPHSRSANCRECRPTVW